MLRSLVLSGGLGNENTCRFLGSGGLCFKRRHGNGRVCFKSGLGSKCCGACLKSGRGREAGGFVFEGIGLFEAFGHEYGAGRFGRGGVFAAGAAVHAENVALLHGIAAGGADDACGRGCFGGVIGLLICPGGVIGRGVARLSAFGAVKLVVLHPAAACGAAEAASGKK